MNAGQRRRTMGKSVLVVDDSNSMRQLVSYTIKNAGYDVCEAVNGKDGLAKATGQKVDMVVTDLNMPEMDGIEMIKQLRGNASYRFTPILMLTTESQEEKKQEGKKAGASAWIVKPFVPEALMEVVNKLAR
jgi:two-component system chemotaxis response regulator CheY